jgi:glutamyl-tRNA reductase
MTNEQFAAIDRLTKSLTAKLLHPQIAALRGSISTSDDEV